MILEGLTIQLKDNWLCTISEKYPKRKLELIEFQQVDKSQWRGVLRTNVSKGIKEFCDWMRDHPALSDVLFLRCEATECHNDCSCDAGCSISFKCTTPEFAQYVITNNVYLKMPILLEDGTIYLKVASTDDMLRQFYQDISQNDACEIHIIKKFKSEELNKATLTDKQKELLRVAIDQGYYKVPRTITLSTLAARVGISQSTLGEHLRKAEERIICSYST